MTSLVTTDKEKFEDYINHKFSSVNTRTLIIWGRDDQVIFSKYTQKI